ncbi:MAG: translocation/assembly module TamB domain-containing protein [Prevotella sp.]|jgi:hypothetical protein
MNKALKWILIAILAPILFILILAVLLYIPPVQNWAVKHVAAYASRQTGMEISVGHVNLEFPLDLGLDEVKVIQQNDSLPQVKDTVAHVGHLVADVQLLPLFKKQIQIDEFDLRRVKVNTTNFIHSLRIKGTVGRLNLQAHGIDLSKEHVHVDNALLQDGNIDIALSDTVPPDTTPSQNFWKIDVAQMKIDRTNLDLHMPGDTMEVKAGMGDVALKGAYFDLYKGLYSANHIDWKQGSVNYDLNYEIKQKGLDFNHLALSDLTLVADSFSYCDSRLDIIFRECSFKEKSGLNVASFTGPFGLDSTRLWLPQLYLKTPESQLRAQVNMDMDAFADKNPGKLNLVVHGYVGKRDLMLFMSGAPAAMRRRWPNAPLRIDGVLKGNLQRANFAGLNVVLPSAFRFHANGYVANVMNPKRFKARIDLNATTYKLDFLTALLDPSLMKTVRIPVGIGFKGNIDIDGSVYASRFRATEGGGSVAGNARFDADRMAYNANLVAHSLQLQHFLPNMGLSPFTGHIVAKGYGTDFMSPHTRLDLNFNVDDFHYSGYSLANVNGKASMAGGHLQANIDSHNQLLKGLIGLDAQTNSKLMRGTLKLDLEHMDLYHLKLADNPMVLSGNGNIDWASDFKHYYQVNGQLGNLMFKDSSRVYQPDNLVFDILSRTDTTHAVVDCGDFHINLNGSGGYEKLIAQSQNLMKELRKQFDDRYIDQKRLRARLPLCDIYLVSGNTNMFVRALKAYGVELGSINMDMTSSPLTGLNGNLEINKLLLDSTQLDTIRLAIVSDSVTVRYSAQIRNNQDNPQYVFNSFFDGALHPKGTFLQGRVYDRHDQLGVRLGLSAEMEQKGLMFHIYGDDPILGYKEFNVNDSNYVYLGTDRRVSANVSLLAADGQGIQLFTNDEDSTALQDLTLSLHKFDLEKVLSVLPYTPNVKGIMDGDFHAVQTAEELSISSSVTVDSMVYENCPMGDIGTEFVYSPSANGTHKVNGFLYHNDTEVGYLDGTYYNEQGGSLDATFKAERLPLQILNGFIPDQLFGFRGCTEGELSIKGKLSNPDVNGELIFDSCYIFSKPYGVEMRFADDPVRIIGSHLLFENFEMFAHNDSPLDILGSLDFSDTNHMKLNMKMRASNFLLIDSKENPRSETYGQTYVNFFGMMNGPVEALKMRGKLDVLGSTDMTYVLRDSPLSADNELEELVTFTSFSDTVAESIVKPPLTGFDMDLNIGIDEGAHVVCALDAEHTNYIDIVGGGDLRMQYNPSDNLQLRGKYTISSGEMKYSLPVIPLKTFTIQDGSYIQFQGDPMNPALHITATERTKASVSSDGSSGSQMVDFDCGVVLSKTLNDMGVEFIIDAPEDMTISNQLNTLSKEERGKIAVTMLTTGMYLANGNTNQFSMNSALSSFLQSQINNISGRALRTLDLSFGVDNATSKSGAMQTDYSFKFSKRFWNNRLNIQVGGKVSTGADVDDEDQTFFNNVVFDYRLDKHSSKYLKLFYNRDSYDWLEGYVGKYGVGFVWKRRLRHFKDLFRFKDKEEVVPMPKDSTNQAEKPADKQ